MFNEIPRDIEVANIQKGGNGLIWNLGFYIPRFSFLDKQFKSWQFFQNGYVIAGEKITLSMYLNAMKAMRKQLDEWIQIVEKLMLRYGNLEQENEDV